MKLYLKRSRKNDFSWYDALNLAGIVYLVHSVLYHTFYVSHTPHYALHNPYKHKQPIMKESDLI